jgi:hypothetical protein
VQDKSSSKGHANEISFKTFTRILRTPIPTDLDKSAGLSKDLLAHAFINKLKAAVAKSRAAAGAAYSIENLQE